MLAFTHGYLRNLTRQLLWLWHANVILLVF